MPDEIETALAIEGPELDDPESEYRHIQHLVRSLDPHHDTREALRALETLHRATVNGNDELTEHQTKRAIEAAGGPSASTFQRLRQEFMEDPQNSAIGRAARSYGYLVSKRMVSGKWVIAVDRERVPPDYLSFEDTESQAVIDWQVLEHEPLGSCSVSFIDTIGLDDHQSSTVEAAYTAWLEASGRAYKVEE